MYLVPVTLGPSPIQGVGIFATAPIAAGVVVSAFVPGFDLTLDPALLTDETLPQAARDFLEHHSYYHDGRLWMPGDIDMYTNHSFTPNTVFDPARHAFVALRAIAAGDEITNDYREFSDWSRAHPEELS